MFKIPMLEYLKIEIDNLCTFSFAYFVSYLIMMLIDTEVLIHLRSKYNLLRFLQISLAL